MVVRSNNLIFVDTEFTDFESPKLISLGAVFIGGSSFYAESTEFHLSECTNFVRRIVCPLLNEVGRKSARQIACDFSSWIESLGTQQMLVCDHTIDLGIISSLFKLIDRAPSNLSPLGLEVAIPYWIGDVEYGIGQPLPKEAIYEVGRAVKEHFKLRARHHALNDAEALRIAWLGFSKHPAVGSRLLPSCLVARHPCFPMQWSKSRGQQFTKMRV